MTQDLDRLFSKECIAVFEFEDGSLVTSRVTLNPNILSNYGFQNLDGLVDLDLGVVIPKYMFEYLVGFEDLDSSNLTNPFYNFFNLGGKVSW